MKDTLIEVMQAQMDKCTNEQFWAVASVTAADGFFVTQRKDLAAVPSWLALGMLGVATTYSIYFVIHRHVAYYRLHNARCDLLRDETRIPFFMKRRANPRHPKELSGCCSSRGGWCLATSFACMPRASHSPKKKPNKAPEPTTGTVTPRATLFCNSNACLAGARVAPVPVVAHL
jgi:hypothetical protein